MESCVLYILETRPAPRTADASAAIAISMVEENLITEREALLRIDAKQVQQFLHPIIDRVKASEQRADGLGGLLTAGIPASNGAVSGILVFDPKIVETLISEGKQCILYKPNATVEDPALLEVRFSLDYFIPSKVHLIKCILLEKYLEYLWVDHISWRNHILGSSLHAPTW